MGGPLLLVARRMGATTVEVPTNHVAMVSHPQDVVNLIETAASNSFTKGRGTMRNMTRKEIRR
jgi:hypothetical protein